MGAITVIFMITILYVSTNSIKYQPKGEPTGVIYSELAKTFISYNKWQICYYYDLSEYYDKIEKFKLCIEQMHLICSKIPSNETCAIISNQFNNHLESIKDDAETLESFENGNHRERRAPFEFIGKINNLLFGIMDAETARLYDEKINELQEDATKTSDLMKHQTLLVKGSIELNNKTFSSLKENVETLDQEIVNLSSKLDLVINEMVLNNKFRDIAQIATLITLEHIEISKELMTVLQNSIDGKISAIIPFKSLNDSLQIIAHELDNTQKLPIDIKEESLYHIYKITSVRSTLINKKIMIEMSIPILEKDEFKLFKAIPIPIPFDNYFIIMEPSSKYFLLNSDNLQYIPLEEDELNNCKHTLENQLICTPYSPINYNREQICELNILPMVNLDKVYEKCNFKIIPKTNYIIQINHQDKYYCVIDKQYTLTSKCKDGNTETEVIQTSGILEVEQNCIITTDDIKIRSHNVKYFNDTRLIVPKYSLSKASINSLNNLNLSERYEIKTKKSLVLIQDYTRDFKMLSKQVEEQLEQEKITKTFEKIHYDKQSHTYALSMMTIIIIIITIIAIYLLIFKFRPIWKFLNILSHRNSENTEENRMPGGININIGRLAEDQNQ